METYIKKEVLAEIRTSAEVSFDLIEVLSKRIENWLKDYYDGVIYKRYSSKDIRLSVFTESVIYGSALELIFATLTMQSEGMQELIAKHSSTMRYHEDEWDSVRTSAELIAYCDGIIYDIIRPKLGSGQTFRISPKINISSELKAKLDRCYFLPPMTETPVKWKSMLNGGYVESKMSLILGDWFNIHDKPVNLKLINKLQTIPYELTHIVDTPEEEPDFSEIPNTKNQRDIAQRTWKMSQIQSRKVYEEYKNIPFYFVWNYDKRGRIYSRGYDINVQGNEYRKASLRFHRKEELTDRGIYWLKVDIANTFGLDKLTFDERISWVNDNISSILDDTNEWIAKAEEPLLFEIAIKAYEEGVLEGKAIGHIARLDATASGPQLMSVISRDEEAMKYFNVLGDEKRYDYYTLVAKEMYRRLPDSELWEDTPDFSAIRKLVKKCIMTTYYNSEKKPEELFGKGSKELKTYYEVIGEFTKGARRLQELLNDCWNDNRIVNSWRLPDSEKILKKEEGKKIRKLKEEINWLEYINKATPEKIENLQKEIRTILSNEDNYERKEIIHTAYCPVRKTVTDRIELHEIKARTNFMITQNKPNPDEWRSLAVNVIHSLDAWICREVCMDMMSQEIDISPIHDSFGVHPNYCDELRVSYRKLMARLYKESIVSDIIEDITGIYPDDDYREPIDGEVHQAILNNTKGHYIC